MPAIIKNEQQVNALAEIEEALSAIGVINKISEAKGGELSILFRPEKGRKLAVALPDSTRSKVLGILLATKDRLAKEVRTKAAKFHISLDEKDLACINGPDVSAASPGKETCGGSNEENSATFPENPDEGDDADTDCEDSEAEDNKAESTLYREPDLF